MNTKKYKTSYEKELKEKLSYFELKCKSIRGFVPLFTCLWVRLWVMRFSITANSKKFKGFPVNSS